MTKRRILRSDGRALIMIVLAGCIKAEDKPILLPPLEDTSGLAAQFGKYYQPVQFELNPGVPEYTLPLTQKDIQNFDKISFLLAGQDVLGTADEKRLCDHHLGRQR